MSKLRVKCILTCHLSIKNKYDKATFYNITLQNISTADRDLIVNFY